MMEDRARQLSSVCRFCLSQNSLVTLTKTMGYILTTKDVELYTGIPISEREQQLYAICQKCRQILEDSINFRDSCMNNDIVFKKIFGSSFDHVHDIVAKEIYAPEKNTVYTITQIEILKETPAETLNNPDDSQREIDKLEDFCDTSHDESETNTSQTNQKRTNRIIVKKAKRQLCVLCGGLFSDLTSHIARAHSKRMNSCLYCNIQMNDFGNLRRHINTVHMKKIIKSCGLCSKGFTNNNSYISHMRSQHNVGETYKCGICCKTFNHKSNYRVHYNRVHSNAETQYQCSTCSKVFRNKAVLHVHQRVHSNDRPYECNQCSKCFKSSFARNVHQLTHSGIQFSCTFCSESFKYKSMLFSHVKKKHSNSETVDTRNCENLVNSS